MRILVVSDSHGNIVRLKHVIGYANAQKLDAIIHCGDWDNVNAAEVIEREVEALRVNVTCEFLRERIRQAREAAVLHANR